MTQVQDQQQQQERQRREQQIERQLRQNWRQIRYRILDQFGQVSTADLDAATSVNDLIARIADKTHHSERYVQNRLQELAGVGAGQGINLQSNLGIQNIQGQPYGA